MSKSYFERRQMIDWRLAEANRRWTAAGANLPMVAQRRETTQRITAVSPTSQHHQLTGGDTAVSPHTGLTGFKIVKIIINGNIMRFLSTWDRTEYVLGKRLYQEAMPNKEGGYYVFKGSREEVTHYFRQGAILKRNYYLTYGLLLCEVEPPYFMYDWDGRMVEGDVEPNRVMKAAVSGITPLEYLGRI